MSGTQTFTGKLVVQTCPGCGTVFGLNAETDRIALRDGSDFRCTNTKCPWDTQHYVDDELTRTKRALEQAQRHSAWNREEADRQRQRRAHAERVAAAQKGVATKLRKRAANGVCPCCNRTFGDLARHMKTKHPGFGEGES